MADLIRHKRSSDPSAVPTAGDLELGELALNTTDGRLFTKKGDNSVVELSISAAERTKLADMVKVASTTDTTQGRLITTGYLDIGKLDKTPWPNGTSINDIRNGPDRTVWVMGSVPGMPTDPFYGSVEFKRLDPNSGILTAQSLYEACRYVKSITGFGASPWMRDGFNPVRARIAVLGTSLSAHNALSTNSWPAMLQQYLGNSGADNVQILNFATNGMQSDTALNDTSRFQGGKTAVQALIDSKPNMVLVELGLNDVLTQQVLYPGFAITTAQAKTNITTVVNALIAAGIITYIIRAKAHDATHATPATLLNRHVIPAFWTLRATGQLANCWSMEIEGDALAADRRTAYANYEDYCDYASGLSGIAGVIDVDFFRAARIGGLAPDRLHLNELGMSFIAASVAQQLPGVNQATFGKNWTPWSDPNGFFTDTLESSGGKWVRKAASVSKPFDFVGQESSKASLLDLDNWALAYRPSVMFNRTAVTISGEVDVLISRAAPATPVYAATGTLPFFTTPSATTDSNGYVAATIPVRALGLGTTIARYKIGDDIYGPLSLTVGEDGGSLDYDTGWQNLTLLNSWVATNPDNIPQYRRIGKVVYLRGGLVNDFANNNTQFWAIPADLRPVGSLALVAAGSTFLVGNARVYCTTPDTLFAIDLSTTSGTVQVGLTGLSWPID